ncbi:unnamed protein product [Staurois parvus]|uniref:Uncharacterized protein n=1 Tax=Staurois parvus TaxID=386267 RepID=A0ABN9EW00_9NEOB|nr:unnamed protein product [Staurois parvus]
MNCQSTPASSPPHLSIIPRAADFVFTLGNSALGSQRSIRLFFLGCGLSVGKDTGAP